MVALIVYCPGIIQIQMLEGSNKLPAMNVAARDDLHLHMILMRMN